MSANENKLTAWLSSQQDDSSEEAPATTNGAVVQGDSALSQAIRQDVAQYIERMAAELSIMARQSNFDLLAYFLDMTRAEARAVVRRFDQAASRGR
jgi:hypothetical protein